MKLLVVVDMQNDFIDGTLGTPEAQAIVPRVAEKVQKYVENGEPILYTRDTHFSHSYMSSQEGQKLPVLHCLYNTHGWQIHSDVYQYGSYLMDKYTFGSKAIASVVDHIVNDRDIEEEELEIEMVGLCTDVCVISNAMILKAYYPEIPITVDSSCCAGVTPASHENALNAMKMCQINII